MCFLHFASRAFERWYFVIYYHSPPASKPWSRFPSNHKFHKTPEGRKKAEALKTFLYTINISHWGKFIWHPTGALSFKNLAGNDSVRLFCHLLVVCHLIYHQQLCVKRRGSGKFTHSSRRHHKKFIQFIQNARSKYCATLLLKLLHCVHYLCIILCSVGKNRIEWRMNEWKHHFSARFSCEKLIKLWSLPSLSSCSMAYSKRLNKKRSAQCFEVWTRREIWILNGSFAS